MLAAGLALLAAPSARADICVTGHYTFVTGDTATRVSYFTGRRVRVQSPDNQEIMFDSKTRDVTIIDNGRRIYWEGPVAMADSLVDGMTMHHWALFDSTATDEQKAAWTTLVEGVNNLLQIRQGQGSKRIAGYPCGQWIIEAGPYLHLERWVARALMVEHFDRETEKVATGAVLDPVGRAMMAMFWQTRAVSGMPLGATMTFGTPQRHSSFTWEAVKVTSGPVPASAWEVPAGYEKADFEEVMREDWSPASISRTP
jgi:hypothetical protein